MIESIMYFAIGFFAAGLTVLVVVPLVHGRAVRLTTRRLEAALPASAAEVCADKDLLRAEFAVSTRRLEVKIEQLTINSASQRAELGRTADAINRLKIERNTLRDQLRASAENAAIKVNAAGDAERALAEKESALAALTSILDERAVLLDSRNDEIAALTRQVQTLKEQLNQTAEEARAADHRRAAAVLGAERALAEKEAELAKLISALDERAVLVVSQNTDIAALTGQVQTLNERLAEVGDKASAAEESCRAERMRFEAASQTLMEERAKFDDFHRCVAELVPQVVVRTTEARLVARQTEEDLQGRVAEQSRLLQDHERELNYLRQELAMARQSEADSQITARNFSAENSRLQAMLERANGERARQAYELATLRRQIKTTQAA
jgi:chromosome segregation ATPase